MQDIDKLKEKACVLPNLPGVYRFLDAANNVIYVGKAKDLRKRVLTYFSAKTNDAKRDIMLKKAVDIKHLVTKNESDALLLENNLIKKLQPKYNVLLKDDKTFPWICIKNEAFPRILLTRRKIADGSRYFGPFTSVTTLKILLDMIRQIYPIRTCKLNLSQEAMAYKKYGTCLEYHIGKCKAPCVGLQSKEEYAELLKQATEIIKGNIGDVLKLMTEQMNAAIAKLNFEEAKIIRENMLRLENYEAKSVIVNPAISNVDVFSIVIDTNIAFANFMRVANGLVVQTYSFEMKLGIMEEKEALLSLVIIEMEQRLNGLSTELIVPFLPETQMNDKIYTVPQRGDKHKLLDLSVKNVKLYRIEKLKYLEKTDPEKHTEWILNTIKTDLHLPKRPRRIECFDNSNIQGTNPVAACVVFVNAKPAKREYRHFNIKTVDGPDDFASMEEIVLRRYKRLLREKQPLPQLIVIDGGKGQLHAAVNSLKKLDLFDKIPILGLAKRLEEIYFPDDQIPLHLNKNSETLRILMHIRDEAHRFGIRFHRDQRSKNFITSELTGIKGVGEFSANKLIIRFKTVSAVKQASEKEIAEVVDKRIARLVRNYFDRQKKTDVVKD